MISSRRSFLVGLGAALITAPAIVRAGSLMPVRQMIHLPMIKVSGIDAWGKPIEEIVELGKYCGFMNSDDTGSMTFNRFREITGITAA